MIHTGTTTISPNWAIEPLFAARMFNSTLMLAGVCIVIISYFAISELITTHRLQMQYLSANDEKRSSQTLQGADSSAIDHADARRHRLHRHRHVPLHAASDSAQRIRPRSSLPDERADDRAALAGPAAFKK